MKDNYEEVKVYGSFKFPVDGVQYAMGEIGGSWSVGADDLKTEDIRRIKQMALDELLSDAEKMLRSRSQAVIDNLVKERQDKRVEELEKQLDLAREEYLKLKNDKK